MFNRTAYVQHNIENTDMTALKNDCLKLGAMLITYRLLTSYFVNMIFIILSCRFLSGKMLSYTGAAELLQSDYKDVINSTTYAMVFNSSVTITSLIITLLFGCIVLGFSFNGYLKPSADGAKKGLHYFPACFVANVFLSVAINAFVHIMDSAGVTIPEADFSIKTPSTAAILFEFLYLCIIAPFIEETVYRGMILGALTKYGEFTAILLSSLCFGLMHGNIPQAVSAFGTGLMYACVAVGSGSILPSLIIHALNNTVVSIYTIGNAMKIPHIDTINSTAQIAVAMIGFYVLMTRASYFGTYDGQSSVEKKAVTKAVFTRPAIIIYLLVLISRIIIDIVTSNS